MEDVAPAEVAAAAAAGWTPEAKRQLPMHGFLDNTVPFILGACKVRPVP